jgi:hypothetical protein
MTEEDVCTTGVLQVGSWYDDGWTSPYLRLRFEAPANNPVLRITLYNDDSVPGQRRLAVRQGANSLLVDEVLPVKEMLRLSVSVSAQKGSVVDISLSTDEPFDPSGSDERMLGTILTDCRLVSGA